MLVEGEEPKTFQELLPEDLVVEETEKELVIHQDKLGLMVLEAAAELVNLDRGEPEDREWLF